MLCKAHFINADLKEIACVLLFVNVDYFLIWNGHKASFVPNSHSKTKVQQLLLLNPLYEPQAWGKIIPRIRIRLRICRSSLMVALQSSFRWMRHDNFIELICWESIRRKRLFTLLSINIIPKIQDEIEFWVVSSFDQLKRQQSESLRADVWKQISVLVSLDGQRNTTAWS